MQEKVIMLATPVFFLLIFIEWLIGRLRGRNTYRANDAINSISLGILSQVSGAFMLALRVGIYGWLVQHVALFRLPADSLWVWAWALLLYDLCYYWLHRMSHEVNLLWAAHVVHHQSEDYNLSTALRQTSTGSLLGWIFYIPMALLGFPVTVFLGVALIDLLYQFWVHTQQIGKLGWLDRVLVTPSNHRAHHGVNDVYLDKNYGGILILWDRLFGTFVEEQDDSPVVYGTRGPLRSWNPLWANFEVYHAMWQDAWRTQRWQDKLRLWIAAPGWRPADVAASRPKAPFELRRALYDPPLAAAAKWYCGVQFALALGIATHFLGSVHTMPLAQSLPYALWLGASLWTLGGLLEQRAYFVRFEALRLVLTAGAVLLTGGWFGPVALPGSMQAAVAALAALALAALWVTFKFAFQPATEQHGYLPDR